MQELEKILKELEKFTFEAEVYNGDFEGADIDNLLCLGDVRDVLRNHMNNDWIPVDERLPDNAEYILLSFTNFPAPSIGRYEKDTEGGAFYLGDCDEADTCISMNLFVNAWMPLPEPYQPESKEPEEGKEWKGWKERILRDFMKKGER